MAIAKVLEANSCNAESDADIVTPMTRSADPVTAEALPMTLEELLPVGGPLALIAQAERRVGDQEASFWLGVLEAPEIDVSDALAAVVVPSWIRSLRRRLGVTPSPAAIRAQTRERVRRFRARKASFTETTSTAML